jgi:hypothetical protein
MLELFGEMYDGPAATAPPLADGHGPKVKSNFNAALDEDDDVSWSANPAFEAEGQTAADAQTAVAGALELNKKDWGPNKLKQRLTKDGSPGICNALTAAWLGGMLNPGEGRTGVSDKNIGGIKNLKSSLDGEQQPGQDSSELTMDYAAQKLAKKTNKDVSEYVDEIGGEVSGPNAELTPESVAGPVAEAFSEPGKHDRLVGKNIQGTIDMAAKFRDEDDDQRESGHQLGYKNIRDQGKLQVYDQNTGLKTLPAPDGGAHDDASMSAALGAHLHETYVADPYRMPGDDTHPDKDTTAASFATRVMPMAF